MQLYQRRDFGSLIGDTLTFFKQNGKNYFKNFFIINGLLILLLLVFIFVLYGQVIAQAFQGNLSGQRYYFEEYLQQNSGILIGGTVLFMILIVAFSVIMYSFPVIYLKLYGEDTSKKIQPDQILKELKINIRRILVFILGCIFVFIPLVMVLMMMVSLLMALIIGFLLLPFIMPVLFNVMNFMLYHLYNSKDNFFTSLSYAVRAQFSYLHAAQGSPFWKYWGSTLIMVFMYYVITMIFTLVPTMILMGGSLVNSQGFGAASGENTAFAILMFVFQFLAMAVSLLLYNFIFVNGGLQYYDSRTDLHRNVHLSEIDTIGSGA